MLKKILAAIDLREALAIFGAGLFVFGIMQIYIPAGWITLGAILAAPFLATVKRGA